MATVSNTTEATILRLSLVKGGDDKDQPILTNKNFSNVAPNLSDEDARSIGSGLANLQNYELNAVYRIDTGLLAQHE